MGELGVTVNVRVTQELRDKVDERARELGQNRSEFVTSALEAALIEGQPRGRQVRVVHGPRQLQPPHLCSHPLQLRSEPHPQTGESRCLGCESVVRPLR